MSQVKTLRALGEALKQAAAEGRWAEVQRVDVRLAKFLASLSAVTPDEPLRQALSAVRDLHQQVRECAQVESDVLAQKMALSRRNREGASAYAGFMDAEDFG
ncbi:hypothetical protein [Enterobacter sp. CC120223-11]|uniref:hypothetical protein n=1 Tax=Enterobacter sp. CC120223-11 TaxID=1378073 RepID=UPI000BCB478B|nr:hypothetical protein [Enterobacter sp. CC120223-11]SNY67958.1 protein FliT [Enterobacter sp. CC120223-11]